MLRGDRHSDRYDRRSHQRIERINLNHDRYNTPKHNRRNRDHGNDHGHGLGSLFSNTNPKLHGDSEAEFEKCLELSNLDDPEFLEGVKRSCTDSFITMCLEKGKSNTVRKSEPVLVTNPINDELTPDAIIAMCLEKAKPDENPINDSVIAMCLEKAKAKTKPDPIIAYYEENKEYIDIHYNSEAAFRNACMSNKSDVAKYIYNLGEVDLSAYNHQAFHITCLNQNIEMAKWFTEIDHRYHISMSEPDRLDISDCDFIDPNAIKKSLNEPPVTLTYDYDDFMEDCIDNDLDGNFDDDDLIDDDLVDDDNDDDYFEFETVEDHYCLPEESEPHYFS